MNLISSREINLGLPLWEAELFGVFTKYNDDIYLYFLNRQTIYVFSGSKTMPEMLSSCSGKYTFPLPYKWKWIDLHEHPFLLLSESLGVDIREQRLLSPLPPYLRGAYQKSVVPDKHLEEDEFLFDGYCISHKGMSGYRCTKGGKHVWDFQGRAYLYTEITQYENCIFFGTGGYGGYFYALDIETGKPIISLKTGGTSCIVQKNNLCYFLRYSGKTELICLDLGSGQIVDRVIVPGKASLNSRLQMIDNEIHTITFQYKHGRLVSAFWHTIQV